MNSKVKQKYGIVIILKSDYLKWTNEQQTTEIQRRLENERNNQYNLQSRQHKPNKTEKFNEVKWNVKKKNKVIDVR